MEGTRTVKGIFIKENKMAIRTAVIDFNLKYVENRQAEVASIRQKFPNKVPVSEQRLYL